MFIFSRSLFGFPREQYPLESWIDSGKREAAIDPDFPIIDPHHHLWDARIHDKGWPVSPLMLKILYSLKPSLMVRLMANSQDPRTVAAFTPNLPAVMPYMENEILRDIQNLEQGDQPVPTSSALPPAGHNVVATVYLECGWSDPKATSKACEAVPEVAMAQSVANNTQNRLCTGIVGHVPLKEGAEQVRNALEKMQKGNPNLRGIRDELCYREGLYPFTTSEDKAYNEDFRSGFSVLSEFNLTYDVSLYQDNLPALQDLALAFPKTTIICNHLGGPVCKGEPARDLKTSFELWAPAIKNLAQQCPNVQCKLSGLGMAFVGFGFENRPTPPTSEELAAAWEPYILHCIDVFGVDRCMFASNFPVDKVSCSYTTLFNAFKLIVKDFSLEDKKKLFHDNAARIYRLQLA